MSTPELLSALADGQLLGHELTVALEACSQDDTALECWNTYHLIGDFLRSPADLRPTMTVGAEIGFASRLTDRLAQEPITMAAATAHGARLPVSADMVHHRGAASNDGIFRWKLVAGLASLAAVCALAWDAAGLAVPASGPQLVQSSSPQIVVTSAQGLVVRDARLEEFLAAHRQFGTASALQESSGFLRNTTFEISGNPQSASGR